MSVVNFFLALVPIIWLIIALTALKMPGHRACVIALIITVCLAFGYWRLDAACTGTAVLEGVLNALWPICLVIIAALFTYNLVVRTGAMEAIKKMLGGVSMDMRVLALLIGWGFGCFMEGMAGFGTAVAIPASMLVGIGMNPIAAVVGCLVLLAFQRLPLLQLQDSIHSVLQVTSLSFSAFLPLFHPSSLFAFAAAVLKP